MFLSARLLYMQGGGPGRAQQLGMQLLLSMLRSWWWLPHRAASVHSELSVLHRGPCDAYIPFSFMQSTFTMFEKTAWR